MNIKLTRRGLLQAGSCLAGVSSLGMVGLQSRLARATSGSDLKFIFVINYGGWDPTRVFAAEFDNPFVDMESDAGTTTYGDLTFVDHADRPSVAAFFEEHHHKTLFMNGVLVPSIAHENCLRISMTGSTAQDRSDWGAILAGDRAEAFALPQVVVGAPSFPGKFGSFVTRTGTGGQLEALLTGDILDWSDQSLPAVDPRSEAAMDRYLARRVGAAADGASGATQTKLEAMELALSKGVGLKDLQSVVDWDNIGSFAGQSKLAVDLLSLGVSRVANLGFSYYGWDTHANNDLYQSANFENLFQGLDNLMTMLAQTPGETEATLADETVVVVLSEMGRTPQINGTDGKDHWPYTCTMIVGPGITGSRVVGAYDQYYYGKTIDPATAELAEDATNLSADWLGATLLKLADIDPAEHISGVSGIDGVLA